MRFIFLTTFVYPLLWSALTSPQLSGTLVPYSPQEVARMGKGEVVVRVDESKVAQKGRVEAAILIQAPARQIWKVMNDCDGAPEFVPGLRSCKVLQYDDHSEVIEHKVKFTWLLPATTYVFRAEYQEFSRIDFKKVDGELKELEGTWILEPVNRGQETYVIYSVYLDPGFFVPQWLVQHILRGDLPQLLTALRNRVSELYP